MFMFYYIFITKLSVRRYFLSVCWPFKFWMVWRQCCKTWFRIYSGEIRFRTNLVLERNSVFWTSNRRSTLEGSQATNPLGRYFTDSEIFKTGNSGTINFYKSNSRFRRLFIFKCLETPKYRSGSAGLCLDPWRWQFYWNYFFKRLLGTRSCF